MTVSTNDCWASPTLLVVWTSWYSHLRENTWITLGVYAMTTTPGLKGDGMPANSLFRQNSILPVAWPVLQSALALQWKSRLWPLGKMTQTHWMQICQLHQTLAATSTPADEELSLVANLPGNLQLGTSGGWLAVRQLPV